MTFSSKFAKFKHKNPLCGPMMGCARNLTNIFRLCTFYDFEEKVIKLLRHQTSIMFLARVLKNIPLIFPVSLILPDSRKPLYLVEIGET